MAIPGSRTLFAALDRANARRPWSHNSWHSGWVLGQARAARRRGGRRALDVGCGTGQLALRLNRVLPEVVGLEPDAPTAALARRVTGGARGVSIVEAGFDDSARARLDGRFDLIVFVAVLHHLPLVEALRRARSLLAPGGRIVIVGLAGDDGAGLPLELVSMLLNPIVGLLRHPIPPRGRPASMTAPTAEPIETLEEVRTALAEELPGARLRRSLFWRYRAVWVDGGAA